MRLGWLNPRPNDFSSPDERPLKDLFSNIQDWSKRAIYEAEGADIPDTGGAGVTNTISWATPIADADSVNPDNNDSIQAPPWRGLWLVEGIWTADFSALATFNLRVGWTVNGADTKMTNRTDGTAAGTRQLSAPFSRVVAGGDLIRATVAFSPANCAVGDARLTLAFTPVFG